jgi:hypothetical protein
VDGGGVMEREGERKKAEEGERERGGGGEGDGDDEGEGEGKGEGKGEGESLSLRLSLSFSPSLPSSGPCAGTVLVPYGRVLWRGAPSRAARSSRPPPLRASVHAYIGRSLRNDGWMDGWMDGSIE